MKKIVITCILGFMAYTISAQKHYDYPMPDYTPTQGNLEARAEFQDMKFGMFIHWGVYSILADGEWVMLLKKIKGDNYARLADFFNPQDFNADEWVKIAKDAGMKYITITSRHHDSFSMFDTDASDFNIVDATPYGKDPLKELAEACKKEGIKLNFYYSLLDWKRDDYKDGKKGDAEAWNKYVDFMKAQLTELLTNYGEIGMIWFDGHWDQKEADWQYDEIYPLIHKLSPNTLIANNHHIQPIAGEDIQTFERDLPGENHGGYSEGVEVSQLPLESCATMASKWGYSIYDQKFKSTKQLIHFLVKAAGKNGNLLLNVGPMPNGKIQPEFVITLKEIGEWTAKYGESIYGTRGDVIKTQDWGTITKKDKTLYVHILNPTSEPYIFIPELREKISSATLFDGKTKVKFKQMKEGTFLYVDTHAMNDIDEIIKLYIK
ncbi:alpha-L-fucosidase [Pseudalgibacter alginicilyticus]|uniref:alpha-L-fucosidase n=1 Tax=Pseudalgibacter alginicilyticus TaxID=1736674 RepID=A0A0P0CUX0_9FLAO|nr:alpha-L-fucosidase [Pseudalgibacter alginicilyticus]ALJ04168.1 alpha-L-fucosidase [Pseudalgibacter alginicilyticus]